MRKNYNKVKAYKQEGIELAINFVRDRAQSMIADYKEPVRKGLPRGHSIGWPKKKYHAAFLCVLYPNCLKLKEVAELAQVRDTVIMTWRAEKNFRKFMKKQFTLLGQEIAEIVEETIKQIDTEYAKGGKDSKGYENLMELTINLIRIVTALDNEMVIKPFIKLLQNHQEDEYYTEVIEFALREAFIDDQENVRNWESRSEILEATKATIEKDLTFLTDVQTWKRGLESPEDREEILKECESLKRFIFDKLDLLTGNL